MMRVLILGGSGMLGHKVFERLSSRFEVFATFQNAGGAWENFPMYADCLHRVVNVNAMDFDSVVRAMAEVRPAVVINCIGIIKQLREAHDPRPCIAVNALFPHQLAQLCTATGARLIHMSTDCVFSGRRGNYAENDVADAEDLYGRTKYLGEVSTAGALTLRTSIIGRDFQRSSSLVEWFLTNRGDRVRGFRRAIYTGLTTAALAEIIVRLLSECPELSGVWHVASEPISKFDLLTRLRDALHLDTRIDPDDTFACDRSLNASRLITRTGWRIPSWDEMIRGLAAESPAYDEWRKQHGTVHG